jgi:metal-responsive CopG/Arc/MetJ family transcriptional regulator
VRRTQLYLDDQLWNALHARARSQRTTISELVREAVRERYLSNREQRMKMMQEFIGSRKVSSASNDPVEEVRSLRRGNRIERFKER